MPPAYAQPGRGICVPTRRLVLRPQNLLNLPGSANTNALFGERKLGREV